MNGAELAAELYDRHIPIEAVLGAATVMLNNLSDEQAQMTVLAWMAQLQNGEADALASVPDTRAPL